MGIWVRKPPRLRPRADSAALVLGRARRAHRIDLQGPASPVAPATRDRVPLPVRGVGHWCQGAPIRAIQHSASTKRRPRASLPTRMPSRYPEKTDAEPLDYRSLGTVLGETRKEMDIREDNRWRAGCPINFNTTSPVGGTNDAIWPPKPHPLAYPAFLYRASACGPKPSSPRRTRTRSRKGAYCASPMKLILSSGSRARSNNTSGISAP